MTESKDIEQLFQQYILPYEGQITKLQEEQKQKDIEICTLKHAIYNLSKIISSLQNETQITKQPAKKEEEKKNVVPQRPQTSNTQLRPPTKKDDKQLSFIQISYYSQFLETPISDHHSLHSEDKEHDAMSHKSDDKAKKEKKQVKKLVPQQPEVKSPKKNIDSKKKIEETKTKDPKAEKKKEIKKPVVEAKSKKETKVVIKKQEKIEKKEKKEEEEKKEDEEKKKNEESDLEEKDENEKSEHELEKEQEDAEESL